MSKKGFHEKQMELARRMLEQGIGMIEIVKETGLSEEDVLKEQRKMKQRLQD
jgi:hypothetical protein